MKYIVVGLGSFGAPLATRLTAKGNEVIGIDTNLERVNALKDKISHCICLNATNEETLAELPLKNTDVVVVCIGKDQGANVMVTAMFKNLGVKKLISRATNTIHEGILKAIGVDEIINPEAEAAERWSEELQKRKEENE